MKYLKTIVVLLVTTAFTEGLNAQQAQQQAPPTMPVPQARAQLQSQAEPAYYKPVLERLMESYNKGEFDNIYNMYSTDMQKFTPKDKTTKMFTDAKDSIAGALKSIEYDSYRGSIALYKATFEKTKADINISIDSATQKIRRFALRFPKAVDTTKMQRNTSLLILPVKGEWTVTAGGDNPMEHTLGTRAGTFELAIKDSSGRPYKTNAKTNEDFFSFGQEISAPCDGEVVMVVDGVKDNTPRTINQALASGNTLVIKTAEKEFFVFTNLKQQSIKVREGDKIKQGKVIAQIGNSGNSMEPQLHFRMQNAEDLNKYSAIKIHFSQLLVNGLQKADYSPTKGEKLKAGK